MDLRFASSPLHETACDLLAIGVGPDIDAELASLDRHFEGHLLDWVKGQRWTAKEGTTLSFASLGRVQARNLMLIGVGDRGPLQLRKAAGKAGRAARDAKATSLVLALGGVPDDQIRAVLECAVAGNYAYDAHKPETDRDPALATITLHGHEGLEAARQAEIRSAHQGRARDLVNAPAADIYPATLAQAAADLTRYANVSCEVWGMDKLKAEGCVGVIAVGQGSANEPKLAHIRYRPPGAKAHIALVGKGVTFDSGGLSLKPSSGMQTMRCDMGGAGAVVGAVGAIAELGLPVNVDGIIGAVENMNGANSYKLGDILHYRNGVTVEIHNTDAEGRLVLADCLIRACEVEGVTHVVDLATLTGACAIAVGSDFTGLFTADDDFAAKLSYYATHNGEGMWRLPLHKPYNQMLKGEWGQIKNVGGREAGATTAALFLQHFVADHVTWAHLDIAGSAFMDKANGFYAAGATGQPVRTLVSWVESLA